MTNVFFTLTQNAKWIVLVRRLSLSGWVRKLEYLHMATTYGMGYLMEEGFMGQPGSDIYHDLYHLFTQHSSYMQSKKCGSQPCVQKD